MILAVGFVLGTAILCVTLPLMVYGTTLAAFGLPHVVAEMRYVYGRFRTRWTNQHILVIGALLTAIVTTRIIWWLGYFDASIGRPVELALVGLLIAITLPTLWRRHALAALLGLGLLLGVAWGAATSPVLTALCLAVLHNFTPVGFFYEVLPAPKRRRAMVLCCIVFLGLPLLIASGVPFKLFHTLALTAPESTLIELGPLAQHIGVYVPRQWHGESFALYLFSAVVFAQCMHYAAVIHILPRLQNSDSRTNLGWGIALLLVGGATLVAFSADFFWSRRAYGLFAAVHAWIEVPILLAALLGANNSEALSSAAT